MYGSTQSSPDWFTPGLPERGSERVRVLDGETAAGETTVQVAADRPRRGWAWPGLRVLRPIAITGVVVAVVATILFTGPHHRHWWDISLTSGRFLGVLGGLTLATTILTGTTWDIQRLKRLRRSGLLVAVQVLTAATLGAAVNSAGGFYGTVSDLLGVQQGGAATLAGGGSGEHPPIAEPWLQEARKSSGPGHGVWTSLTVAGRRTGYNLPAWAYVPDAYFDPRQPNRKFPVVLLLAGFPGAVENWERQGHMVHVLDKLMRDGEIPPMILVSVTQNPEPNRDSECVDAVGGASAETYLAEDVPEALDEHFRIMKDRSAWSLMGYSTGGYCAVDLALRHPKRFSSAVSLDGYFAPAVDATTGDLFHKDAALRRSYTPAQTIGDRREVPLRFYLIVGDAEPKIKQGATEFAAAAHPPDTVTIVNVPGGHNWGTWSGALPKALGWLAG
jgi:enterochelin esterase-like enzyme